MDHEHFMKIAINQAVLSAKKNEVPIGAVIVKDNKILAKAHNNRNTTQNALNHAECLAISKACKKLKSWRLENTTIYITLQPCPMCAGAILNARIPKVVYGASCTNMDNENIIQNIFSDKVLNHKPEVIGGVLEENCSKILSEFFKNKR